MQIPVSFDRAVRIPVVALVFVPLRASLECKLQLDLPCVDAALVRCALVIGVGTLRSDEPLPFDGNAPVNLDAESNEFQDFEIRSGVESGRPAVITGFLDAFASEIPDNLAVEGLSDVHAQAEERAENLSCGKSGAEFQRNFQKKIVIVGTAFGFVDPVIIVVLIDCAEPTLERAVFVEVKARKEIETGRNARVSGGFVTE